MFTAINGHAFGGPAEALEAYAQVRDATVLTISLERQGEAREIVIELVETLRAG